MKPITLHVKSKPSFRHDCKKCKYLGTVVSGGHLTDLYYCDQVSSYPTVIARYSDEGSDYSSGLIEFEKNFHVGSAELFVAATLARQADYLK